MKRKRILHVFAVMDRGGAETRTIEMYQCLKQDHDIQMDFFTTTRKVGMLEGEILALGGQIHRSSLHDSIIDCGQEFQRCLIQGQYDVMHTHLHLFSGMFVTIAKHMQVPIRIAHFRNTQDGGGDRPLRHLYRFAMRQLIWRYATDIVGVSKAALRGGLGSLKPDQRCRTIYNGLDLTPYNDSKDGKKEELKALRQELGWSVDAPIVINVARFVRQKNHAVILETARRVLQQRPDVRFLLVGDGPLRAEIESQIEQHGLKKAIHCIGKRSDVPSLLQSSNLFFFPSLWEGLPGALLEAMASGLSTVASDIEPVQEMLPFFEFRIMTAAPDDVDGMARHIFQALQVPRLSSRKAKTMFMMSPFTVNNAANQFASLYKLM